MVRLLHPTGWQSDIIRMGDILGRMALFRDLESCRHHYFRVQDSFHSPYATTGVEDNTT